DPVQPGLGRVGHRVPDRAVHRPVVLVRPDVEHHRRLRLGRPVVLPEQGVGVGQDGEVAPDEGDRPLLEPGPARPGLLDMGRGLRRVQRPPHHQLRPGRPADREPRGPGRLRGPVGRQVLHLQPPDVRPPARAVAARRRRV
ncbi:MAG: hypothetical protein AVDCRST_MAG10-2172, partial [uncultured Acidimicrobiales bacterium]